MADAVQVALLKSLAACVMFLENGGPGEVDPDSAVRTMESVAHEMSLLSEADQAALETLVREVAATATHESDREFYRTVMLGFVLDEDDETD